MGDFYSEKFAGHIVNKGFQRKRLLAIILLIYSFSGANSIKTNDYWLIYRINPSGVTNYKCPFPFS